VLIDDLVTRGVTEPYRMFTSRAEYRLSLRADNADLRLTGRGMAIGLVGRARSQMFNAKQSQLAEARQWALGHSLTPNEARALGVAVNQDGRRRNAFDLLALPGVTLGTLAGVWPEAAAFRCDIAEQLEIEALYAGYLDRQEADIVAFRKDESLRLAPDLPYGEITALSHEVRLKLAEARPATLGAAGRIEGVTPAALAVLLAWLRKQARATV
jgi:tRNA uridine 5-carboxymethylaminomethyl modification enzyme